MAAAVATFLQNILGLINYKDKIGLNATCKPLRYLPI
jgi:hypothetical protein